MTSCCMLFTQVLDSDTEWTQEHWPCFVLVFLICEICQSSFSIIICLEIFVVCFVLLH